MEISQQTHCAKILTGHVSIITTQVLSGCQNSHNTTEKGKVLLLAVYYWNQSSLNAARYAEWDVLMLSVATCLIAPIYLWMPSAAVAKRDRPVHRQSAAGLAVILLLLGLWRNMFEHCHTNSQRGDTEHGVEDDSLQDGKGDGKDHYNNSDDNDVGDRWWGS